MHIEKVYNQLDWCDEWKDAVITLISEDNQWNSFKMEIEKDNTVGVAAEFTKIDEEGELYKRIHRYNWFCINSIYIIDNIVVNEDIFKKEIICHLNRGSEYNIPGLYIDGALYKREIIDSIYNEPINEFELDRLNNNTFEYENNRYYIEVTDPTADIYLHDESLENTMKVDDEFNDLIGSLIDSAIENTQGIELDNINKNMTVSEKIDAIIKSLT